MIEKDVIHAIANYGDHQRRYELMLPNVYTQHDNEADLFAVRKSGYCDEFEIKVSRADFLADKKKFVMWRKPLPGEGAQFSWKERMKADYFKPKLEALAAGGLTANYFWYVVAEGVAEIEDVPGFAGLIVVTPERLRVRKLPEILHKAKLTYEERYKLARKSTYRFWKLWNQARSAE